MIGIVQVGMGRWGQDWASRVFPVVPSAQLAGCVDSRLTALAETRKLGVVDEDHCFTSLDAALSGVAASAVVVTTDLPSHIPVVKAALTAGKHVLVEKPFAPSVSEAKEAVELADSLGLVLMVSQNYRFFPAVRAVQKLTRAQSSSGSSCTSSSISAVFRPLPRPPWPGTATGTNRSCWTWPSTTSTS